MKLSVREDSKNYACTVVEVNQLFEIENSDKLARAVILGNNIVVPKTTVLGEKMLYFVSGTQLSHEYCYRNNLYAEKGTNYDPEATGYISNRQRRVKALKLRGVISDGMLMPMSSLKPFLEEGSIKALNVGDEFTDINENSLCEKFIVKAPDVKTAAPKERGKKVKLKDLIIENQFHFHSDTAHFAKNVHKFEANDLVCITRKRHGSSFIVAHVKLHKTLSFVEKLLLKLGVDINTEHYGYVYSSGKPKSQTPKGVVSDQIDWKTTNKSFYEKNDIWAKALAQTKHSLEKGISIYGEITGEGIQGAGYTYGRDYALHVYRITQTGADGHVYEFGWEELKAYCAKYGLEHVEEYYFGKLKDFPYFSDDLLGVLSEQYLNKSYSDCKIDEGICIRNFSKGGEIYKYKSPNFLKVESDEQEAGIVNTEDNA